MMRTARPHRLDDPTFATPPPAAPGRRTTTQRVASITVNVALLIGVLGWFVLLRPEAMGGGTTYVIVAGKSMEPTYHSGDLVVVRHQPDYAVGDVVAFQPGADHERGQPLVIHRIVDVRPDGRHVLQGDNNDHVDPWMPTSDQIAGRHLFDVPGAGTYVALAMGNPHVLASALAGLVVFLVMLGPPQPKHRTRRPTTGTDLAEGGGDGATAEAATPASEPIGDRLGRTAGRLTIAAAIVTVVVLGAGVLVASASTLVVDGGVLQFFESSERPPPPEEPPVEEPPPPAEVTVTVEWRLFNNGGQQRSQRPIPDEVRELVEGDEYLVLAHEGRHQNQWYAEVACSTVAVDEPAGDAFGSGTFVAGATGTHIVCLQQQVGGG